MGELTNLLGVEDVTGPEPAAAAAAAALSS